MTDLYQYVDNFRLFDSVQSILRSGDFGKCPSPVISVIMPVYKRTDTFRESLLSVLNQDFKLQYEIVVVDNNTDEPISPNQHIVEEIGANNIFYYRNDKNIGMLGNWNRGIELARAEYITYCHDDDKLKVDALSRLWSIHLINGNKCILSVYDTMNEDGEIVNKHFFPKFDIRTKLIEKEWYEYTLYDQIVQSRGFGVGCLFNRQCMLDIGGYNQEYYPSADYALHIKYTERYGCILSNVPTFTYRMANNESINVYDLFAERDKFFRECSIRKLVENKELISDFIEARYRASIIWNAKNWGKRTDIIDVDDSDLRIIRMAETISAQRRYRKMTIMEYFHYLCLTYCGRIRRFLQ